MWVRCPECGTWCYAEKKNFIGRILRLLKTGDQELGQAGGEIGDKTYPNICPPQTLSSASSVRRWIPILTT